jgi:hypothetical protein
LSALLAGALIALVPVFVWELVLRPQRERFQVAKLLRVEIQVNLRMLIRTRIWREESPKGIVRDFFTTRIALEALAGRMGELPARVLDDVLRLYRSLEQLDTISERYREHMRELTTRPEGSAKLAEYDATRISALDAFDETLNTALDLGIRASKGLDEVLISHWAPEERRLASPEDLEIAARSEIKTTIERRKVRHESTLAKDAAVSGAAIVSPRS